MVYVDCPKQALNRKFRPGQVIWACAFWLDSKKTGKRCYSPPVKGELCSGNTEAWEQADRADGKRHVIQYFVPYAKSGKLSFSKAVNIEARMYADTEHEAVTLFNQKIDQLAQWFRAQADDIETHAVPEHDLELPPHVRTETGAHAFMFDDYSLFLCYVHPYLKTRTTLQSEFHVRHIEYENKFVENAEIICTDPRRASGLEGWTCVIKTKIGQNREYHIPLDAVAGFPGMAVYGCD